MAKAKIENIAARFGKLHAQEADIKERKAKARADFFEAIEFEPEELARLAIFYEGDDPEGFVKALYPAWRIINSRQIDQNEWKIVIEEDPQYKPYVFINPVDKKVYQRTVAESTPQPDLDRVREEDYELYERITFQPVVPRELRDRSQISDEDFNRLHRFLQPPTLTLRMEKPREAKPEELEGLETK